MSQEYYERTRKPVLTMPESRLGRLGCYLLTVLWFVILLLPCAMFALATQGEITLHHANVPEPLSHPLMQIRLVMDVENRGLQVTTSNIRQPSDTALCVQVRVEYLLWQSSEAEDQSVRYCDCYERANTEAQWQYTETLPGQCLAD